MPMEDVEAVFVPGGQQIEDGVDRKELPRGVEHKSPVGIKIGVFFHEIDVLFCTQGEVVEGGAERTGGHPDFLLDLSPHNYFVRGIACIVLRHLVTWVLAKASYKYIFLPNDHS